MSAKLQRLRSGEKLTSISASTWNAFVDTTLKVRDAGGVTPGAVDVATTILKVRNNAGATIPLGYAIKIGDPVLNRPGLQIYAGTAPGSLRDIIGVTLEPIRPANIGLVAVTGVVRATVNIIDAKIPNVDWAAGAPYLHTHLAGRHRIMTTLDNTFTGQVEVTLMLAGNHQTSWRGIAAEDLLPDVGGSVEVFYSGGTRTITAKYDWMHGGVKISSGKKVLVDFFRDEGYWRVIGAECEDPPE